MSEDIGISMFSHVLTISHVLVTAPVVAVITSVVGILLIAPDISHITLFTPYLFMKKKINTIIGIINVNEFIIEMITFFVVSDIVMLLKYSKIL